MALTEEQVDWLKAFCRLHIVAEGGTPVDDTTAALPPGSLPPPQSDKTNVPKFALSGADAVAAGPDQPLPNIPLPNGQSIPIQPLIDLAKSEFGELRITCHLFNNTNETLFLGKAPEGSGEYQRKPPEKIAAKHQDFCIAVSSSKLGLSLTGIDKQFEYDIGTRGDENTIWVIHIVNPRNLNPLQGAQNFGEHDVFGTRDDKFQARNPPKIQGKADAEMFFVLEPAGTPPDPPIPPTPPTPPTPTPPTPAPGQADNASCLITITNGTQLTLTRSDSGTDQGNFVTQPAASLAPGASTEFAHLRTPGDSDNKPGCKGFVSYEIGAPTAGVWRMDWDNPIGSKNEATTSVTPQGLGFKADRTVGNGDENVPFTFTLSGGGSPQPQPPNPIPPPAPPGPKPPGPPGPEPEPADWNPPAGSGPKDPTLRRGDNKPDGWVEYLQQLLIDNDFKLKVDGDFGQATYTAVKKFQADKKLSIVDGIVGDETWAALREGSPQPAATDGRKPHTFEDKDADARFTFKQEHMLHIAALDEAQLLVNSVGEKPIADAYCYFKVTPPGSKPQSVRVKIGDPVSTPDDGQGAQHVVRIEKFRTLFPSTPVDAPITDYKVEAYLDPKIGGDKWSGPLADA